MRPAVGRVVHYMARGSADGIYLPVCRAAIITQINYEDVDGPEGYVGLAVLNPTGLFFHEDVEYSNESAPGSWHWPERAEA